MSIEELGPEFSLGEKEALGGVKDKVEQGEIGGEKDRPSEERERAEIGANEREILDRIDQGGDNEQVLQDIAGERQARSEDEETYLDKDPRIGEIREELTRDWETKNGPRWDGDRLRAEFQDYMYGDPADVKSGRQVETLEGRARQLFSERFPEEAQNYQENERGRVYDYPEEDPAIRDLERQQERQTKSQLSQEQTPTIIGEKVGEDRPEEPKVAETADVDPSNPGSTEEAARSQAEADQGNQSFKEVLNNPEFQEEVRSLIEMYARNEQEFQLKIVALKRENPSLFELILKFTAAMGRSLSKEK